MKEYYFIIYEFMTALNADGDINEISRDDVPGVHEAYVVDALKVKDAQLVAKLVADANRVNAEEA